MNTVNLNEVVLKAGTHANLEDGACVMEMVSYIANEPWSDHPACACPILTRVAIRYNDSVDDKHRQRLTTLIPSLVNSRNVALETKRAELLALKTVTSFLPILIDALNLPEISSTLRAFTTNDFLAARDYINKVRPEIRNAASATYADYSYADAAYAVASASADAYTAYSYASASDAAYAAAADVSDAASDAAYAVYSAYVYGKKEFWTEVKLKVWDEWFAALKEACEIKE